MSFRRLIPRSVAIILPLAICGNIVLQTRAQFSNEDLCRRQCRLSTQYITRLDYSCYNKCLQSVSIYRSTSSAPIRTTTTSNYYRTLSCGIQPAHRQRVVGGSTTGECEFPWMVAVTIGGLFCGGSILDSRHILTAAHCMKNRDTNVVISASQVLVRVGSSQLSRLRVYRVQQITVDRRHIPGINDYDVAVLRLSEELTFSNCVAPICLPQVWEDPKKADYCVAAGWGVEDYYSQSLTLTLKKVVLPIVDNSQCVQSYGSTYVNDLKICAGNYYNGGIDTCQGDSGGPLMCKFGNHFVILGIVSFGSGCARPRYPGIYTRVPYESILTFIKQNSRGYN